MPPLERFLRKRATLITAVQLDLDTDGFTYRKWGGVQRCDAGDWLVNNDGDTYTVEGETFALTYRQVSPGVFEKHSPVWAEAATTAGTIDTKSGTTAYEPGDMLVYNDEARTDGYAMTRQRFDSLYEPE